MLFGRRASVAAILLLACEPAYGLDVSSKRSGKNLISTAASEQPVLLQVGGELQGKHASEASLEAKAEANLSAKVEANLSSMVEAGVASKVSPRQHVGPDLSSPGHLLTQSELDNITNVGCLEAKQQDAAIVCDSTGDIRLSTKQFRGEVSPANYPNYTDSACYSKGEFLCDTRPLLSEDEHQKIETLMVELRAEVPVNCGILTRDPADTEHKQPFYLGIALLGNWPLSALDPGSMDAFGQRVAAQWNMAERWVGFPRHRSSCPNEAMLLIAPDHRQAYLSSASCEFICAKRGGPEVVTAILVNLESTGLAAAIEAGVRQVYHVLSEVAPQSEVLNKEPVEDAKARQQTADTIFNAAQQVLFVLMLAALVGSFVIAFLVLLMAPGWMRSLGKL